MKERVDHVERPNPPWRIGDRRSECGRDEPELMISRAEFYRRVTDLGQQRAAMGICMTCWHTAQRYTGWKVKQTHDEQVAAFLDLWERDPAEVIGRDIVYGERRERLNSELRVIGLLIEAHRNEFDEAMAGLADAATLDDLRAKRAKVNRRAR